MTMELYRSLIIFAGVCGMLLGAALIVAAVCPQHNRRVECRWLRRLASGLPWRRDRCPRCGACDWRWNGHVTSCHACGCWWEGRLPVPLRVVWREWRRQAEQGVSHV